MSKMYGWSIVAVMCMTAIAAGQVRPGTRPAAAPPAAGATAPAANTAQGTPDQQIAACLWAQARNEVELAKLAEQKAKSDSVKDFAAQMIKDHSKQQDTLAREAGNLVNSGTARGGGDVKREVRKVPADDAGDDEPRREGRKEAREDRKEGRDDAREERTTTTTNTGGRQGFSWVAIHRECADQCLQSSKKELSSKEGKEFDQCYIGMQIAAHMKMADELKVLKNHATGKLQQDIEDSLDTTEHHLKEAKKIMDELKDNSDSGSKSGRKSDRDEK